MGKLKPKVFSKTRGKERNVNEGLSASSLRGNEDNAELRNSNWLPAKSGRESESPMDEDNSLILDDGPSDAASNEILNEERSIKNGVNVTSDALLSLGSSNLYQQTIQPALQSNQLTASVSLTPIAQTSLGSATQLTGKHNLPATALMSSSISPKTSAKKPSKDSKPISSNLLSRSVLRPNDMTAGITCSIHCELATGFPALNCHKCQVKQV